MVIYQLADGDMIGNRIVLGALTIALVFGSAALGVNQTRDGWFFSPDRILLLFGAQAAVAPPPQIVILRTDKTKSTGPDDATARSLIADELLQDARYRSADIARVEVRYPPPDGEKYLVAYVYHRKIYLVEIALVPMNGRRSGRAIEFDVTPDRAEEVLKRDEAKAAALGCPDPSVDVVFATSVPEIPTALAGVTKSCESARMVGMTCKTLIGEEASVESYQAFLTKCPRLRVFGNIGHGNPNGIMLSDGKMLSAGWFKTLQSQQLRDTVLYFNSCQVHNDPLKEAVLAAGARTYVGGNVNLWIGPSEEVFKCFWREALSHSKRMGPSLAECERNYYPGINAGDHGVSGFTDAINPSYPLPMHPPRSASAN